MKLLAPILIVLLAYAAPGLRNGLPGKWSYQYSQADSITFKADVDAELTGHWLTFEKCDDRKALVHMPPVVVNNRKTDTIFNNLSCRASDAKGASIDTYFPVCHSLKNNNTRALITLYGNINKIDSSIEYRGDTIIVYTGRVIETNGKTYRNVGHVYTRVTN